MLSTWPFASRIMIGATPATFTRSGCSTPSDDARGAAGVDRVAAGFQDGEGGRGRQIMAGGDGVARAVDGRAMAHDGLLKERAQACGKASATSRVPGGPQRQA